MKKYILYAQKKGWVVHKNDSFEFRKINRNAMYNANHEQIIGFPKDVIVFDKNGMNKFFEKNKGQRFSISKINLSKYSIKYYEEIKRLKQNIEYEKRRWEDLPIEMRYIKHDIYRIIKFLNETIYNFIYKN